jgi:hypothetical protein
MAVAKENSWFRSYVRDYGGVNFDFESGRTYFIYCTKNFVWTL